MNLGSRKILFFSILALLCTKVLAQKTSVKKFDYRIGFGRSITGTEDIWHTTFTNQLNYKITEYWASAVSIDFGISEEHIRVRRNFLQGNVDMYFSPFKNSGKNDFRIGSGISGVRMANVIKENWTTFEDTANTTNYRFGQIYTSGLNFILKNTYKIRPKNLIALKVYTQSYFNDDINSGIQLKFGFVL